MKEDGSLDENQKTWRKYLLLERRFTKKANKENKKT